MTQLENLKLQIRQIDTQLEFSSIEKNSFVIEVGFLTVTTDENNVVKLHNQQIFPTLFSQEAVNEILQMNFRNIGNELVMPKVYSKNEWYLTRKQEIVDIIKLFDIN